MFKGKLFLIIKIALVVVLILYMAILLKNDSVKDIPMEDISFQMVDAEKDIDELDVCKSKNLYRYYNLDGSAYDGYMYRKSRSPMAVEEILIVKLASEKQAGAVEAAMNSRVKNQKTNFDGYGAEQTALLEKNIVQKKGKYVFFAVAKDAQDWYDTFCEIVED